MAALAGKVSGAPPSLAVRARLEARLGRRGQVSQREGEGWLFAHADLLGTNDPFAEDGESQTRLVLAGRLDELGPLREALGAAPRASPAAVALAAWLRWGTETPNHLTGDYALVVAAGAGRTHLVRDRFGCAPLCYARGQGAVLFGTEPGLLLALDPTLGERLHHAALADYVAQAPGDPEATVFEEVNRVPAATVVTLDGQGGTTSARYYVPAPRTLTAAEAPGAVRAALAEAVRRRMPADGPVVSLLSGGLDSSSVACLAGEEGRLSATASIYLGPDDERAYIGAVRERLGLPEVAIDGAGPDVFGAGEALVDPDHGPPIAPNTAVARLTGPAVSAAYGPCTVLCGHGGDEVVSTGVRALNELAMAGRWRGLFATLGTSQWTRAERAAIFARMLLRYSRGGRAVLAAKRRVVPAPGGAEGEDPEAARLRRRVAEEWKPRYAPGDRPARTLGTARDHHLSIVTDPLHARAFEDLDRERAASGAAFAYPFWDRDVVETCLGVPAEVRWQGGLPRAVLRAAMAELLPPLVAQRTDKFDFSGNMRAGMTTPAALSLARRELESGRAAPYADMGEAMAVLVRLEDGKAEAAGARDLHFLWRVVMLSSWLGARSKRAFEAAA